MGGTFWAFTGGLIVYCARKLKQTLRDNLVPMMGVLGAFIFAAQMLNFSIPGTGSSGHLGGGLILTILLGPHAAFIVMASVLTVQAFFFADGGLLALGCNIFNLGFFPAFVAYPLLYRPFAKGEFATARAAAAAIVAAAVSLELGAFFVVLQTKLSGISELPFGSFMLLMLPIHLAIGVVEGLATAAVVSFVVRARPEALPAACESARTPKNLRPLWVGFLLAAAILGGVASWFASSHPDGLEWSMFKVSGKEELETPTGGIHETLAGVQKKTAILPDYGFRTNEGDAHNEEGAEPMAEPWPAVSAGTSVSGIVGGLITLALAGVTGLALKARPPRSDGSNR